MTACRWWPPNDGTCVTNGNLCTEVFNRLLDAYGPQDWWPGESSFEIMVGAVLVQATSWKNVEKAISALDSRDMMSPARIREVSEEELAQVIYSCGYYRMKAKKLKALASYLGARFGDDLDAMNACNLASIRDELLGVYGIGEETADAIVLYALNKPSFVVDAYTRRLFTRIGVSPRRTSYRAFQRVFMDNLPADTDLFNEYHALIVKHGSNVCLRVPRCDRCCLSEICAWWNGASS